METNTNLTQKLEFQYWMDLEWRVRALKFVIKYFTIR